MSSPVNALTKKKALFQGPAAALTNSAEPTPVPVARIAQRSSERLCAGEPIRRQLLQYPPDGGIHVQRDGCPHGRGGNRARLDDLRQHSLCARARVRWLAYERLVEHAAERVHVAGPADVALAGRLLRTHVVRRADAEPRLRETCSARCARSQGDAEVGEQRPPFVQHHVGRLDVAVDDALAVRVVQRLCQFSGDPHGFVHRQLLLSLKPLA